MSFGGSIHSTLPAALAPSGDDDLPPSIQSSALRTAGPRTDASTPSSRVPPAAADRSSGLIDPPTTGPHTPSHTETAHANLSRPSDDEAQKTPAPVLSRVNGLFGEGKDQALNSSRRRLAAAGTMVTSSSGVSSATSSRPEHHSSSSAFKTAKSAAFTSFAKITGGSASRKAADVKSTRPTLEQEIKDLQERILELEKQNAQLQAENKQINSEYVRCVRVIAQLRDEVRKKDEVVNEVTSLKQPRDIKWSFKNAKDAEEEAVSSGTPRSRAQQNDPRGTRRRGLSLTTRIEGQKEVFDSQLLELKKRVETLLVEQEKLTSANKELQRIIAELDISAQKRRAEIEELERARDDVHNGLAEEARRLTSVTNEAAEAQKRLEALLASGEERQAALREATLELERLAAETQKLREEKQALSESVRGLTENKGDLERQMSELAAQTAAAKEDFEAKYSEPAIERAREVLDSELGERRAEKDSLIKERDELKIDVAQQLKQLETQVAAKASAEAGLASARASMRELEGSLTEKRKQETTIRQNMEKAQELVLKAQTELTKLEAEKSALTSKATSQHAAAAQAQKSLDTLTEEEQRLKTRVLELETKIKALQNELREVSSKSEAARDELSELAAEVDRTKSAREQAREAEAQTQRLQTELGQMRQEKSSLSDQFRELTSQQREKQSALSLLEADVAALQTEMTALTEAKERLQQEIQAWEARALKAASRPHSVSAARPTEITEDFEGEPVDAVETSLTSPRAGREELAELETQLGELRAVKERETAACASLRETVRQLEQLRSTREDEFRSLSDKCDDLTRQIEELRATESAMAHERSRASSRGLSLEKEDYSRGNSEWTTHTQMTLEKTAFDKTFVSPTSYDKATYDKAAYDKATYDKGLVEESTRLTASHAALTLADCDALRDVVGHLEKQKFHLMEALKTLADQSDDAKTSLSMIRNEISENTSRLHSLRAEVAAATSAFQIVSEDHAAAKQLLANSLDAQERCEAEIAGLRQTINLLRREKEQLLTAIKALKEEKQALEKQISEKQAKEGESCRALETKSTESKSMMDETTSIERAMARDDELEEIRQMRHAAIEERETLRAECEKVRAELGSLNDQIKQRQIEEQNRMARVEEDRICSRKQFDAAMRDKQMELKKVELEVCAASDRLKETAEAETRARQLTSQSEAQLRELQEALANTEMTLAQSNTFLRSHLALLNSQELTRQKAQHAVNGLLINEIRGLEHENTFVARQDAKVQEKIRSLQVDRVFSPSQQPWGSPLSPSSHPRFHPGSPPPIWVEWTAANQRGSGMDDRQPQLALFEQQQQDTQLSSERMSQDRQQRDRLVADNSLLRQELSDYSTKR